MNTGYETFGYQPHETVFGTFIKPWSGEMTNRLKKDAQEVEFEFIPKEEVKTIPDQVQNKQNLI